MKQEIQRDPQNDSRRMVKPADDQMMDAAAPPTSRLTPREMVMRMQRTHGNAAVARMLASSKAHAGAVQRNWINEVVGSIEDTAEALGQNKKIVTLGTERVEVANDDEAKEAQRIIDTIQNQYGIQVSSPSSVDAIKDHYSDAPDDVLDKVRTKTWKFKELQALERALAHFAPILGSKRKLSDRAGTDQEITSVGKAAQSITDNKLDTTTLGEFFKDSKNFSMFKKGEDSTVDFPGDNAKQLEGTAVHEIAHGLMKYLQPEYNKALSAYWKDETTALADPDTRVATDPNAEAPITFYGGKNAREDLSEAVMMYFVEPQTLKNGKGDPKPPKGTPGNPCPIRYQFLEDAISKWTPPVGDFPEPDKETAYA